MLNLEEIQGERDNRHCEENCVVAALAPVVAVVVIQFQEPQGYALILRQLPRAPNLMLSFHHPLPSPLSPVNVARMRCSAVRARNRFVSLFFFVTALTS